MNENIRDAIDWLNEIITNPDGWRMFYSESETKSCAEAALALLKEQEALLNKAYELLVDMEMDCFCDDLTCDDGWCDEHCTTNGPTPECIERWLRKQIEEGL